MYSEWKHNRGETVTGHVYFLAAVTLGVVLRLPEPVALFSPLPMPQKENVRYVRITTSSPVQVVATWDLDNDRKSEVITGRIDGVITAYDFAGLKARTIWEVEVEGIPQAMHVVKRGNEEGCLLVSISDPKGSILAINRRGKVEKRIEGHSLYHILRTANLDGIGKEEIVAVSRNFHIDIFNQEGRLRHRVSFPPHPRSNFHFNDLVALDVGDVNGDERQEMIFIKGHGDCATLHVAAFDNGQVKTLWTERLTILTKTTHIGGVSHLLGLYDINRDGVREILIFYPSGLLVAIDGRMKKEVWKHPAPRGEIGGSGVKQVLIFADVNGDGRKEIVLAAREMLLLSPDGLLEEKLSFPSTFWSLSSGDLDGDGSEEIVSSSRGAREKAFYIIKWKGKRGKVFSQIWEEPLGLDIFEPFEFSTIDNRPSDIREPFVVLFSLDAFLLSNPQKIMQSIEKFYQPLRNFNRPNYLIVAVKLNILRPEYWRNHRLFHSHFPNLIEVVKFLENREIPFFLTLSHGTDPSRMLLTLDEVRKVIETAPKMFLGLSVEEAAPCYGWAGPHSYQPIFKFLELMRIHRRKMLFIEHHDPWLSYPSDPFLFQHLLSPKFKETLVPFRGTEVENIDLGGILALWVEGRVENWGRSVQFWGWSTLDYCFQQTPPDYLFRQYIFAVSLGARFIEIYPVELQHPKMKTAVFSFLKLLKEGTFVPIKSRQLLSISPLALQLIKEEARKILAIYYIDRLRTPGEGFLLPNDGLFYFPFQFENFAYKSRFKGEFLLPQNYFGLVPVFSPFVNPLNVGKIKKVIRTDMVKLEIKGKFLPPDKGGPLARHLLEEASESLPFQARNVFLSAQKFKNFYLVYLIDPNLRLPQDIKTFVKVKLRRFKVVDGLTGKEISRGSEGFWVKIPAGSFRLLKIIPVGL